MNTEAKDETPMAVGRSTKTVDDLKQQQPTTNTDGTVVEPKASFTVYSMNKTVSITTKILFSRQCFSMLVRNQTNELINITGTTIN